MAVEEAKMVEVESEYPPEPPLACVDVIENNKAPLSEEMSSGAVEKSEEAFEGKPAEGIVDREVVLARVVTEKKDAIIKAWEESERSKIDNRAQTKLAAIGAWENSKKAELEAELRKIEEELEKKRAKYTEKIMNRLALLHKTAEEKRAITEAKRSESLLKAEELSAKYRATGATPTPKKLLGWF